jgi:hypothetical protein
MMSTPSRQPCGECLMRCTMVATSEAMGCAIACAGVGTIGIGASTSLPTRDMDSTAPVVPGPVDPRTTLAPDVSSTEPSTDVPIPNLKTVSPTIETATDGPTQGRMAIATPSPEGLGTRPPETQAPISAEGLGTRPPIDDPNNCGSWKCTMSDAPQPTPMLWACLAALLMLATFAS